jgi:hypothetical protein
MLRSLMGGLLLVLCSQTGFAATLGGPGSDSALPAGLQPMRFALLTEGPTKACIANCRQFVAASGMLTADTPRQFVAFARDNMVQGATVVLESDGGSVLGALEFGRAIRRLGFSTTVGRVVERHAKNGAKYGELVTRADCQSMCTFVLLGGVKRQVPLDARVLVHQIWLGDRREDAVAANYTAEDLVVVQRDIGSIMQYTVDMGGDIELVALSLKIPPWEPMRALTRDELRRTHLDFAEQIADKSSAIKTAAGPAPSGDGLEPVAINGRGWLLVDRSGRPALARTHPLTFEGERIGSFELLLACGETPDSYALTYREARIGPADRGAPRSVTQVELAIDDQIEDLKISGSEQQTSRGELDSVAKVALPAQLVRSFASDTPASMTFTTESRGNPRTSIRVGNAGLGRYFRSFDASCKDAQRPSGEVHVELDPARPIRATAQAGP